MFKIANYWNQKWDQASSESLGPNPFAEEALSKITEHFGRTKNIHLLDLGAGSGKDSRFFAQHPISVSAIDVSKHALSIIAANNPDITTEQQDFLDLRLPSQKYDVVYAHLSLHYFDDDTTREILKTIRSTLKPDGLFFVKVKSIKDWQYGQGTQLAPNVFKDGHIRHFFTVESLSALLDGFAIKKIGETSDTYNGHQHGFVEAVVAKIK